jgi:hypothetical protein
MASSGSGVTVGELIRQLSLHEKNDEVLFGNTAGEFTFYRVKERGGIVQIEFNEEPGQDYKILKQRHVDES